MYVCGMHAEVTGQLGRVCSLPLPSEFQGLKLPSFSRLDDSQSSMCEVCEGNHQDTYL